MTMKYTYREVPILNDLMDVTLLDVMNIYDMLRGIDTKHKIVIKDYTHNSSWGEVYTSSFYLGSEFVLLHDHIRPQVLVRLNELVEMGVLKVNAAGIFLLDFRGRQDIVLENIERSNFVNADEVKRVVLKRILENPLVKIEEGSRYDSIRYKVCSCGHISFIESPYVQVCTTCKSNNFINEGYELSDLLVNAVIQSLDSGRLQIIHGDHNDQERIVPILIRALFESVDYYNIGTLRWNPRLASINRGWRSWVSERLEEIDGFRWSVLRRKNMKKSTEINFSAIEHSKKIARRYNRLVDAYSAFKGVIPSNQRSLSLCDWQYELAESLIQLVDTVNRHLDQIEFWQVTEAVRLFMKNFEVTYQPLLNTEPMSLESAYLYQKSMRIISLLLYPILIKTVDCRVSELNLEQGLIRCMCESHDEIVERLEDRSSQLRISAIQNRPGLWNRN